MIYITTIFRADVVQYTRICRGEIIRGFGEMRSHNGEMSRHSHRGARPLQVTLVIVLGIMIVEIIGGILSNSLALLGDAGHMLVDALALGLSLFAITLARRPPTPDKTYGYHRAEIMAALANGTILVLVSIYIFYEAYQRFFSPPEVQTPVMITVAAVGLTANVAAILLLRRMRHGSLNIQAAFWHILGDTISSVGVIVAGIIIAVTGWYAVDSIIAVIIGVIILWGAIRIVRESTDILLEAVPGHIQIDDIVKIMKDVPGVEDVHDIHAWTITSGIYALSAHLIIEEQTVSKSTDIIEVVNRLLARDFEISHTTLQLECEKCESCPSGIICTISRPEEHR
jgi:cobalt-zinc-cadmium efflux system protein